MANEITLSASLAYEDSESADIALSKLALSVTVSTKKFAHVKMNVGTTEEALDLGEITSLGYCLMINRDSTNFVELRAATAGTRIIKLKAGEAALFRFGSGVTAPYIIADTAACQIEYLLISN